MEQLYFTLYTQVWPEASISMKLMFHCHTNASPCSNINSTDLSTFLSKSGFGAVIVTDHDQVTKINWPEGKIILGSEITTAEGDVIGIFLKKAIPKGQSIKRTSELIHQQGGLVVAPHPCDTLRREAMGTETLLKNIEYFDIIEDYNSRNLFQKANKRASAIAEKYKFPTITGSDAHTLGELPNTYVELDDFSDTKDFLAALQNASSKRKASGPIPHGKTVLIKLAKKIERRQQRRQ